MKSEQWKTYRTRFLVNAKQLSSNLTFTDHLGRQHSGRKGDYLVESSDGVLSIAPRQIFEDIYVPMSTTGMSATGTSATGISVTSPASSSVSPCTPEVHRRRKYASLHGLPIQPLQIETVKQQKFRSSAVSRLEPPVRAGRKTPQPVRERRASSQLGWM